MSTRIMDGFETLFVMGTIHRVLRAEKALKEEGIAVETQVTPREISADCGMVVLVRRCEESRALDLLRARGIPPREAWREGSDGFERARDLPTSEAEGGS